jgi:hypothetical protein
MQGALYWKRCEGQHWEMLHKEHSEHVNNTLPKYVVCQGSTARSSQTSDLDNGIDIPVLFEG